ncbi:hypothetical protein K1719_019242 [Acacia pycnantha]|nr:hypothetical protein K1719_019242 [Acacia pycnantha]
MEVEVNAYTVESFLTAKMETGKIFNKSGAPCKLGIRGGADWSFQDRLTTRPDPQAINYARLLPHKGHQLKQRSSISDFLFYFFPAVFLLPLPPHLHNSRYIFFVSKDNDWQLNV